jgi:serine/threonine protein kinase
MALPLTTPVSSPVGQEVTQMLDPGSRPSGFPDLVTAPVPPMVNGTRVDQYQIIRMLGRGGMGCVYLAWDERLRRKVALKVLLPQLASDDESRARFLREGRAAAAVTHDHIVTVYDAGQDGDTAYLAMQYLQGMTLHRYLETKGPPPIPVAVRIVREVAAGLVAAHAIGLLHRDIKPGNILLEAPKGRVKLLDFGLATPFSAGDAKLTQTGMVVGTPTYMSPEQARCWKMDHRSDLFSLGVVLYQMCAGRVPFTGPDTMAILTALAVDSPEPVSKCNPKVPLRLELLIERMLDKNPDGRPQSAAELVADLKSIERELISRPTVRVLEAEVIPSGDQPVEDDPSHQTEVAIEAEPPLAAEVDDTTRTPRRTARNRSRQTRRVSKKRKAWNREVYFALIAVGLLIAVGVLATVVVNLIGRASGAPSAAPSAVTPPTVGEVGRGEQFHPRDLPPGWPPGKPLPPGWRPGMPLPPEHLLPKSK